MITKMVLIVDDDPGTAKLFSSVLNTIGLPSYRVGSLSEAKSIAECIDFDVVLLDLMLPDSKGLGTVKEAATFFSDTPFIVVSGQSDDRLVKEVMESGASGFLCKGSICVDQFLQALHNALRIRAAKVHYNSLKTKIDGIKSIAEDLKKEVKND